MKIFHNGKYIYSIDMIISYIHLFNKDTTQCKLNDLLPVIEFDMWGDDKVQYTPLDILQNNKKIPMEYREKEMEKIENADLNDPIIVFDYSINQKFILEGLYTLVKSYIYKIKIIGIKYKKLILLIILFYFL